MFCYEGTYFIIPKIWPRNCLGGDSDCHMYQQNWGVDQNSTGINESAE